MFRVGIIFALSLKLPAQEGEGPREGRGMITGWGGGGGGGVQLRLIFLRRKAHDHGLLKV
jgi:hypothetical protein